ncbi:MAG: type II toxin-antitoxin system VapC family toxin [Nanoarchaeota archaeon]
MIGLDTTFVIDLLKGRPEAMAKSKDIADETLVVTPVTVFEVFMGVYSRKDPREEEERQTIDFFDQVETIPLTPISARLGAKAAGTLARSGESPQSTDAMIASALAFHGCTSIVTRDKDFLKFKGLKVINY